jgi:hypothetical protein
LREQGYICCYCGDRITDRNSHVEHLIPMRGQRRNFELSKDGLIPAAKFSLDCRSGGDQPVLRPLKITRLKKHWYETSEQIRSGMAL